MSTDELEAGSSVSVSDESHELGPDEDAEKPKRKLEIGVEHHRRWSLQEASQDYDSP